MPAHAVIIGGGIAGLAAATALQHRSWQVTILEREPAPAEVGAGITLWPNALRALDALGIGSLIRSRGLTQAPAASGPAAAGGWHAPIPQRWPPDSVTALWYSNAAISYRHSSTPARTPTCTHRPKSSASMPTARCDTPPRQEPTQPSPPMW